jgi:hypothetical protein
MFFSRLSSEESVVTGDVIARENHAGSKALQKTFVLWCTRCTLRNVYRKSDVHRSSDIYVFRCIPIRVEENVDFLFKHYNVRFRYNLIDSYKRTRFIIEIHNVHEINSAAKRYENQYFLNTIPDLFMDICIAFFFCNLHEKSYYLI